MTGKVVSQYSYEEISYDGTLSRSSEVQNDTMHFSSIQVATTVTFTVAIIQVIYLLLYSLVNL